MQPWKAITALGITQICGWGTTYYALGALSDNIIAERGWPKPLVFGAFSAALLIGGVLSRPIGRAIDTHGGKTVMAAGSILAALGCLILGFASHPWGYVLGWLVLGPAMRMVLYDAAFPALTQLAGSGARRAISYLTLFGGLASTVFWPISHLLSETIGWQQTFLVFAAINLIVCLPLHLLFLAGPPGISAIAGDASSASGDLPLQGRERRTALWLFASVVTLNGLVFSSLSAHLVPLLGKLGFAAAAAVALAAVVGPSQVTSRIGEIVMGRRLKAVSLGTIACLLLPAAFAAFFAGAFSWESAALFAVLYGMSNGLVTIMRGAVPLALFGPRGYGLVLGTIATPQLILNALAPTLFGFVIDGLGARWSLALCFAISLLALAAMVWLARLHPR